MPMNLDVSVRLLDGLTTPAKKAEQTLDRFGAATSRLATRTRTLSREMRTLAGAMRTLSGGDNALDRSSTSTGRLRGSMAGLGDTARRQVTGITALGRATDKLAANAGRATVEMKALRSVANSSLGGSGFVGAANRQMHDMLDMQRQAIANMRRLNAGGGGRPRGPGGGGGSGGGRGGHGSVDSMMGHAFFGATSGITLGGEAIREVYQQGADRVDEYTKMAMAGVDAAQIARNRAAALSTARTIGGSGINANLATLRHLRFALGSDEEATRSLTPVAQATSTMRMMNPDLDAEGNAFAMAKAAEMKGVSQDPAKFRSYMGLMANTAIATGGKTTGEDFRAFTALSKGTSTFLTPDAYAGLVSSIGGELGAGKTGNALAMSTRANIGGVMTAKGRAQLSGLGLWDDKANSIKNGDAFQADPHRWVEDNLIPVLKANGMLKMDQDGNVDPEKSKEVGRLFAKMFSNSNVASFFTLLTTQGRRYEKDQALRNKVAVDNFALQMKSPTYAMGAMTTAFKDMLGTMSEADMPELISGLNGLTSAFNGIAAMDPKSLGLVTELGGAFLALGPSIWATRLAYMTFVKPLRELPALLGAANTGIRAIAASELVASAATMAWNGSALILSTTLGRLLAIITAVTAGFEAGTWLSKKADQLDAQADDKGGSPRALQAETMGRQRDLAKQNRAWNTPGLGWWQHFKAGQAAEEDRRYLDARGQGYEETPLAGARARGGPVGAGLTYLVGERGPELFTPGRSGGITSNTMLGQMASRASNDNGEDGETIAREIRFMSYELGMKIEDLNRTMTRGRGIGGAFDRYGDGSTNSMTGGSGGGGGSGSAGGRRGGRGGGDGDNSSTPSEDKRTPLEKAGIGGSGKVESGLDAFNIYGPKKRGEGIRPIDPGSAGPFGLGGFTMPGTPKAPSDGSSAGRVRLGQMGKSGRGTYGKFDAKAPSIMGGLMDKYGLTKEQAAGVLGNLGHESARFTAYHEGGQEAGKGGVGWAQWTGPRRRAFESWVAKRGLNPTSDEASWRYLTEGDPETRAAIARVKRQSSVEGSMTAFEHGFERSADYDQHTGRILKPKSVADRLMLAKRAFGMSAVGGSQDGTPEPMAPVVPPQVAERARRDGERRRDQHAEGTRSAGQTGTVIHNSNVFHVHGGDPKQVAEAVHQKFAGTVKSHLSDGAYA